LLSQLLDPKSPALLVWAKYGFNQFGKKPTPAVKPGKQAVKPVKTGPEEAKTDGQEQVAPVKDPVRSIC